MVTDGGTERHDHIDLVGGNERALLIGMARLPTVRSAAWRMGWRWWRTGRIGRGGLDVLREVCFRRCSRSCTRAQLAHQIDQRQKGPLHIGWGLGRWWGMGRRPEGTRPPRDLSLPA